MYINLLLDQVFAAHQQTFEGIANTSIGGPRPTARRAAPGEVTTHVGKATWCGETLFQTTSLGTRICPRTFVWIQLAHARKVTSARAPGFGVWNNDAWRHGDKCLFWPYRERHGSVLHDRKEVVTSTGVVACQDVEIGEHRTAACWDILVAARLPRGHGGPSRAPRIHVLAMELDGGLSVGALMFVEKSKGMPNLMHCLTDTTRVRGGGASRLEVDGSWRVGVVPNI